MSLIDAFMGAGGKEAIAKVAANLGLDAGQAAKAVGMILPKLTDAMKKNAEADGGSALAKAVKAGDHGRVLDDPDLLAAQETKKDGNGILGHVLGSKDASRAIASSVASAIGIENETIKQMLPMVASMAMGALSKGALSSGDSEGGVSAALGDLLKSEGASKLLGSLFG